MTDLKISVLKNPKSLAEMKDPDFFKYSLSASISGTEGTEYIHCCSRVYHLTYEEYCWIAQLSTILLVLSPLETSIGQKWDKYHSTRTLCRFAHRKEGRKSLLMDFS